MLYGAHTTRLSNLLLAKKIFPLDYRMRLSPSQLVTANADKLPLNIVLLVLEDGLKTDPYNYDLNFNIESFRNRILLNPICATSICKN